ncbi:MAG: arylesterase [Pseudomonadota bacterium]
MHAFKIYDWFGHGGTPYMVGLGNGHPVGFGSNRPAFDAHCDMAVVKTGIWARCAASTTVYGQFGETITVERFFKALLLTGLLVFSAPAVDRYGFSANASDRPIKIVAFGDSLVAGYQLSADDAFPAQLERALKSEKPNVTVVNAGVSGDTTKSGLARLDWMLDDDVDAVILELGANDALRALPPEETEKALDAILEKLNTRGIDVLIAGMLAPPNLGPAYQDAFDPIYPRLAEKHGTLLYPFFLEGVAARPELNLADGLHPTAEGIGVIVENILPKVKALIARVEAR